MNKLLLREEIKQKLAAIDGELFEKSSSKLSEKLNQLLCELSKTFVFKTLGAYAPMLKEPLWFTAFDENEYEYSLVHMHRSRELSFHPISLTGLRAGEYGLELTSEVRKIESSPQVLIIPGVAFSREGARLGRGRAYYDNFLNKYTGIKIGVCFECQVVDELEVEAHDIFMDMVVTEKNIYRRGK